MKNLYIESVVEEISEALNRIIAAGNLKKEIGILGFDRLAQAIKSLLTNRGMRVDFYLFDNEAECVAYNRKIKGMEARHFNGPSGAIPARFLGDDGAKQDGILLYAGELNVDKLSELEHAGWIVNENLFVLYDGRDDRFKQLTYDKEQLTLREMQLLEKEILKHFDEFCRAHNLRYWVCGGTLLGTIRHKGFIPWDDDVDVFMPWEDYKKFFELYSDDTTFAPLSLERIQDHDKHMDNWSKLVHRQTVILEDYTVTKRVHPVWIDIFPLIGLPADTAQRMDFFKRERELGYLRTELFYRENGSVRSCNRMYDQVQKLFSEVDFDQAEYAGVLGTGYQERDCTTRSVYDQTLRMPFEDIEVNVPAGYKEYLDNLYGTNWMEIPSREKQQSHHVMQTYVL